MAESGQVSTVETDPWIGRTLGQFHLERLIGRGGMGAVYFGRRVKGDFGQEVAIKLASTRLTALWLRKRFLEERQMLASLNHPGIARLLDGGITEEGEPYLVMEYIEGIRLDHYCDTLGAWVAEILRLFLDLCNAVLFVHRNLILHGDLKPANVLVTPEGRVKLLDFGAAKLLIPEASPGTEAMGLGMRAFTPHYASPEQMTGSTITAASDVYSLGVILYRLLTGRLPFDFNGLSGMEVVETLLETRPVPPHEAIGRPLPGGVKPAANFSLRRDQIRGDLDAIVLKALNTDPRKRYASVEGLAADLRNFLERRPVEARRGGLAYRAAKFAHRHTVGIGMATAIAIALALGVAATVREGRVAAREELRAVEGYQNVHRFANFLLFNFYDEVKKLPGSTVVQRRLVAQALGYLDGLSRTAGGNSAIQLDLVEAYTKMGNVLGNPYEENLGDAPKALVSLNEAVRLAESAERFRPRDPLVIRRLDVARRSLAEVHFSTGNTGLAIEYSRAAAQSFETLAMRTDASLTDIQEAASTFDSLGDLYGLHGSASTGDLGAALESYRHSLALHRRALARQPGNVRSQRGVAILQMKIANSQVGTAPTTAAQGYAAALASLGQLPAEARRAMPTLRLTAVIDHKLGSLRADQGDFREAILCFDSARALYASLAARDPEDTRARFDLATTEYDLGEVREVTGARIAAREDYRRVIGILDELLLRDPANLVWLGHRAEALYRAGCIGRDLGDAAEGARQVHEALSLTVRLARSPNASAGDLDRAADYLLSVNPRRWREPATALDFAQRAVEKSRGSNVAYLVTLAKAQRSCGNMAGARRTIERALASLPVPEAGEPVTRLRRDAANVLAGLRLVPPRRLGQ